MESKRGGQLIEIKTDSTLLNQEKCIVYEFTHHFDEPQIRRINKCCVWKSDDYIVRIEREQVVGICEKESRQWTTSLMDDEVTCVGFSNYLNWSANSKERDKMTQVSFDLERVPSKRMILVISLKCKLQLFIDDYQLIRQSNEIDFELKKR